MGFFDWFSYPVVGKEEEIWTKSSGQNYQEGQRWLSRGWLGRSILDGGLCGFCSSHSLRQATRHLVGLWFRYTHIHGLPWGWNQLFTVHCLGQVSDPFSNSDPKRKLTFPRNPVRGFSLIGDPGAEVFVLLRPLRRPRLVVLFVRLLSSTSSAGSYCTQSLPLMIENICDYDHCTHPLPVMEVEEADDGILALVPPSVGDITLNRAELLNW